MFAEDMEHIVFSCRRGTVVTREYPRADASLWNNLGGGGKTNEVDSKYPEKKDVTKKGDK